MATKSGFTSKWPISALMEIKERYEDRFWFVLVVGTFKKFSSDDAGQMAAGIAYYGFLSLFPLILGLIAIFSLFVESSESQSQILGFTAGYLPGSDNLVSSNIESAIRFRGSLGVIAILGLIWSGSAIFGGINRSLNKAWDVEKAKPFYIAKLKHLGMAFGAGVLFIISVGLGVLVQFAGQMGDANPSLSFLAGPAVRLFLQALAIAFTVGIFLFLFKYMPDAETQWVHVWPGAVLAGLLFELFKSLFMFYVERFTSFDSVYGSIAPIIVLLVWFYFSSVIMLLGAELSSTYARLREERN